DVPAPPEDRRDGTHGADHAGAGQRPLSAQCCGSGVGLSVGDHAVVSALVLAEPEPDRTAVEVHQTACSVRPILPDICRLPSGHPADPRRTFEYPCRTTEDADDAQIPDV